MTGPTRSDGDASVRVRVARPFHVDGRSRAADDAEVGKGNRFERRGACVHRAVSRTRASRIVVGASGGVKRGVSGVLSPVRPFVRCLPGAGCY